MELPSGADAIHRKCAKYGGERIRHQELALRARWGFLELVYILDVYICQNCSYSEFFFNRPSWL